MVELGTRVEGSRGRRGEGRDGKVELPKVGGEGSRKKVVKNIWTKSGLS